jgi:hypothetical protein
VSARFIFRCQFCDRHPDPLTQISLEKTVPKVAFGAYVDAMPERWLVWHGRGPYGPPRYACPDHRADLVAYLRKHYGAIGWHPWKRPPYPTEIRIAEPDKTAASRRLSSMPRWGNPAK